jgi:hypothetical protein
MLLLLLQLFVLLVARWTGQNLLDPLPFVRFQRRKSSQQAAIARRGGARDQFAGTCSEQCSELRKDVRLHGLAPLFDVGD